MRMPLRLRWIRLKRRRCPALLPVLLVALILFGVFWRAVNAQMRPAIETLAISSATNRVSETISNAVSDCVAQHGLTYQDFITVETDETGKVTSLTSNLSASSQLKAQIVSDIVADLDGLQQEEFGIPLGTLTGWIIFSGKGPAVRVQLLSAGDVIVDMCHDFEEAGINQTLHRVLLDVSVTVYLLIPGETLSTTVNNQICVAETVIVGEVPGTYLYIGNGAG